MQTWRLINTGSNNGYYNMAVDEAIVIACREGVVPPTLRFYTWDPPCVSIGYFQKIDSSSENPFRRGKKTPPIHFFEDRRDFLVPLIFMALCEPSVHGSSSENQPHPHPTPPLEGEGINVAPSPSGRGPGEGGVFIALCEPKAHVGSSEINPIPTLPLPLKGREDTLSGSLLTDSLEMAGKENGISNIVRRITGGRAVFHGNDLSYSVVCPAQNNVFPNNLKGTYNLIAESFICGLKHLGLQPDTIESKDSKDSKYQHSTLCFDTSLKYEISFNGRKLIGSAQRRWPDIFLQHGSILIDEGPDENPPLYKGGHGGVSSGKNGNNVISINKLSEMHLNIKYDLKDIINAICTGFREALNINLTEGALTSYEKGIAERLLKEKYYLPSWNNKRLR